MSNLAWALMVHEALAAAYMLATQGVNAEVIDIRSLSPIDWMVIGQSIAKTGRVVIVEEGPQTGGVGAELSAGSIERFGTTAVRRMC